MSHTKKVKKKPQKTPYFSKLLLIYTLFQDFGGSLFLQKLTLKVSALLTFSHLLKSKHKEAITFYWCKFFMKKKTSCLLHVILYIVVQTSLIMYEVQQLILSRSYIILSYQSFILFTPVLFYHKDLHPVLRFLTFSFFSSFSFSSLHCSHFQRFQAHALR